MRQGLLNKKIPTLFALVLLVGGIGLSIFFLNNTTSFIGEASPQDEPKNIRISNITDTSFTVSYTTDGEAIGAISYGTAPSNLPNVVTEETRLTSHQLTLTNLSANTEYFFTITSGTTQYSDGDKPFTVTTGTPLPQPQDSNSVKGSILNSDGTQATNVLVYLTTEGASTLSTLTSNLGEFEFNVSNLRSSDLTTYASFSDDTVLNLIGVTHDNQTSASFLISEANPLPPMTLSQSYDFTSTTQPNQTDSSASVNFPILTSDADNQISIQSPTNNESFTDQQPEFDGTALPNAQVEIIIQSNHEIQTTVQAGTDGTWSFRPDEPLEPGEHTITVRSRDENGILRILTRQFTVYAEGSQFTEPSVSPSAPTPTRIPTTTQATPTITSSPSPTPAPDEPTLTPTFTPTPSPFEEPTPTMTPRPTVTPTGSNSSSILAIISFGIFMMGILFVILSRIKSL